MDDATKCEKQLNENPGKEKQYRKKQKIQPFCHSCERRNLVFSIPSGCRIECGMTESALFTNASRIY
jgi:hypothetical protein